MERWYPPAEEMSIKAFSISGTVLATARVLTTVYTERVSPEALSFTPDHQQFDDWRMGQTGFRADWDAHNRDRLTLQGDIYYGDAGQRLQIASYSPPYMTDVQQNAELSGAICSVAGSAP